MESLVSHFRNTPPELVADIRRYAHILATPSEKVNWIRAEGKTFLGWLVLQELFRDVVLHDEVAADRFFALFDTTETGWYFAEVSRGSSTYLLHSTFSLRLAFDAGRFMNQYATFRRGFVFALSKLAHLRTFSFPVGLYDPSDTFRVLTEVSYPISLRNVHITFPLTTEKTVSPLRNIRSYSDVSFCNIRLISSCFPGCIRDGCLGSVHSARPLGSSSFFRLSSHCPASIRRTNPSRSCRRCSTHLFTSSPFSPKWKTFLFPRMPTSLARVGVVMFYVEVPRDGIGNCRIYLCPRFDSGTVFRKVFRYFVDFPNKVAKIT